MYRSRAGRSSRRLRFSTPRDSGSMDELRALHVQVCPAHGGIGHNRPPPDEDSPQVTVVVEIKDAEETIRKT
jgi:hypothetical protein